MTEKTALQQANKSQTQGGADIWNQCVAELKNTLPAEKFTTWIQPLHAEINENTLTLLAPNRFVIEYVKEHFLKQIKAAIANINPDDSYSVQLRVGSKQAPATISGQSFTDNKKNSSAYREKKKPPVASNLNKENDFKSFVEGKSNQLALAAAKQVAENPGQAYNPLFIYGGVGLGKTHLMHAIGNYLSQKKPGIKALYLHSERFVADMIKALQRNAMNAFKRHYRSANLLLIDDIQFFAGKDRSQEEFFHTFNALLDSQQQIIMTCDRYPKEINGMEERLKSRFGWGLTVAVEPPDLETRVAILASKAEKMSAQLPNEVAFFIAKHIQSNVRELEGALKRVVANAHFMGQPITIEFARDALKDLLTLQAKLITIGNIQKTVAEYYKIKVSDLLSKRRNRSIARPRQMSMALAKELTQHSLPEIGDAFGGRDHTTVLHACRKIKALRIENLDMQEDYKNLLRILSA